LSLMKVEDLKTFSMMTSTANNEPIATLRKKKG
jgi:hypothetical protein